MTTSRNGKSNPLAPRSVEISTFTLYDLKSVTFYALNGLGRSLCKVTALYP